MLGTLFFSLFTDLGTTMAWPSKKWMAACAILVASSAFAGKKEREEEGKMLLERATRLSDIRFVGAPAFSLKTKFKVINENSTSEGTYTETWLSRGQWRRETLLGDMRKIVVADGQDRWTVNNVSSSLSGVSELGFLMEALAPSSEYWRADKIEDREIRSVAARCISTKADSQGSRSALCFAKDNGMLVAKAVPSEVRGRIVERTCEYRDYQEFEGKIFPRQIVCFDALRPVFEETVLELSAEPSRDRALFAPPPGAMKSANCQGIVKPPSPVSTPDPELPQRKTPKNPVVLGLSIAADGSIRDLRVLQSVDETFDHAAMKAVQKWRFRPATCDGVPIETMISVSVSFRAY
jgi:TonB family protein